MAKFLAKSFQSLPQENATSHHTMLFLLLLMVQLIQVEKFLSFLENSYIFTFLVTKTDNPTTSSMVNGKQGTVLPVNFEFLLILCVLTT